MIFSNRTVFITGAGGGIGRAVCRRLASEHCSIAAADLSLESMASMASELRAQGINIKTYKIDIADSQSVLDTASKVLADFGKIDILINNAGVWVHPEGQTCFVDMPEQAWTKFIDINLLGTMRVTHAFLKAIIANGYGRIINLGSIAGEVGLPKYIDYAAAKAGVIMFTKTLAMETAKLNITVNCVSPGMVSGDDNPPKPNNGTWIGRSGARTEIAELIAFLASDDASFITGVDYTIDGGRILGPRNANL